MESPPPSSSTVVAIPAYNEEVRIERVTRGCRAMGVEVWVIDDGSSDDTRGQAEKAGARVIRHKKNAGKGVAIRTALKTFLQSSYAHLLFMDADGQHDPTFIPSFIRAAVELRADVVVGNRMMHTDSMPMVRRWTNLFMSWVVSCLSKRAIPDSQCGYRLVNRVFAEGFHPTTDRFDLESEMLIQAGRQGLRIESVPISTIYDGQSSHIHPVWDTIRFIKLVARYW